MLSDATRRYVRVTRHLKPVDPASTLAKCAKVISEEMISNFRVGDHFGDRVDFLQVDSAQSECEMVGSTMLVDLNLVRLMQVLNRISEGDVADREVGRLAADYLAEAYLSCGEYASALAVSTIAAPWRADEKARILDGPHDYERLLMQLHFLLIHESFHWVFAQHSDLRTGAEEMFEHELKSAISNHAGRLLSPEGLAWGKVGAFRADEAISYLNEIRREVELWFSRAREELIADFWAIDGLAGPLSGAEIVNQALVAATSVHSCLEGKDFLWRLAESRGSERPSTRGFLGSPRAGARFVVFRGLCEAVCIQRSKSFDRGVLQSGYERHLRAVEKFMDAARQLDGVIRKRRAQEPAPSGDDESPASVRKRALLTFRYPV